MNLPPPAPKSPQFAPRSGLVTLGETMAMLDMPRQGRLRDARSLDLRIAGAESTVAIGATRLGLPSTWSGRVGEDEFGALITQTLRAEGVDVGGVTADAAAPTGLMFKERRSSDLVRITYRRAGSAGSRLSPEDVDPQLVSGADVLFVTGITAALSSSACRAVHHAIALARDAHVPVALDLNHRQALWSSAAEAAQEYARLVEQADILFVTEPEARLLVDGVDRAALGRALCALGPAEVLVKRGADGAVAVVDDEVHQAPQFCVRSVDPVGAGDAFAAGYLVERALGREVAKVLEFQL